MKVSDNLKKFDFSFFGTALAIFTIGIINLYSATHNDANPYVVDLYKTQILWFAISIVAGIFISLIHPKNFYRISWFFYLFNVLLLVLVEVIGDHALGAQRWLEIGPLRFQPSEPMKICAAMALARWLSKRNPDQEMGFKDLIIPGIIAFIPMILIQRQPDLGTSMIILFVFSAMIFYRRLKWKTIMVLSALAIGTGGLMYQYVLHDYQKKRIINFIDPTSDAKGSGYNAIQSEIAIGSGRLFGKGFKNSSQASLSYLPENHTDFVFSVFNEEHGFFGSLILVILYIVFLSRFIWLATVVPKVYNSLLIIGLMTIVFTHTAVNMSMVMGLMPIVGIPLPFLSFGGTSLLTMGIICGMATSISNSRNIF